MSKNKIMQLYAHQSRILENNPHKSLLCWDTGTGKSLAAIELARKNARRILVIVPKALKEKWQRDVDNCGDKGITFNIATKEQFRIHWKEIPAPDAIIVDEAHYFSGIRSKSSKQLIAFVRHYKVEFIWLLTATPYMSTPWNIYTLGRILGANWRYPDFEKAYFYKRRISKLNTRTVLAVRPGIEEDMAERVREIGDVVRMDECADVPEQVFETEYFALTPEQIKAEKEIAKEEFNGAVKYTKFHQIENGCLKGDEYVEPQFFKSNKIDRILEYCEENKKVAIFCRYNLQIDLYKNEIEKAGKKVFVIRGDVEDRDAVVGLIESSVSCVVLIQASCSEGYELPSVGIVLFASLSFSYKDYKQALGRFLRINKLKKNVYIHLVCNGIDEAVFESIMAKQDFDIEIYARNNKI